MKLKLKSVYQETKIMDNGFDKKEAVMMAKKLNINFNKEKFGLIDWIDGINHEIEHKKTVKDSPLSVSKIALDHLREDPEYYKKLKSIES